MPVVILEDETAALMDEKRAISGSLGLKVLKRLLLIPFFYILRYQKSLIRH